MQQQQLTEDIPIAEKYKPAMEIKTQAEADAYFEKCVEHTMHKFQKSRMEAEAMELEKIAFFAGTYPRETRRRVERLFHCKPAAKDTQEL